MYRIIVIIILIVPVYLNAGKKVVSFIGSCAESQDSKSFWFFLMDGNDSGKWEYMQGMCCDSSNFLFNLVGDIENDSSIYTGCTAEISEGWFINDENWKMSIIDSNNRNVALLKYDGVKVSLQYVPVKVEDELSSDSDIPGYIIHNGVLMFTNMDKLESPARIRLFSVEGCLLDSFSDFLPERDKIEIKDNFPKIVILVIFCNSRNYFYKLII